MRNKEPWSHCCSGNPKVVAERKESYRMLNDLIKPIEQGSEHKAPRWLLRRIKKVEGLGTQDQAINHLWSRADGWLDHWGTIKVCGVPVLVSEPYLDYHGRQQRHIHELAERYGCRAIIFPTGIWCITAHRVVIVPINWDTELEPTTKLRWTKRLFPNLFDLP
jgi:hypothetical protein